MGRPPFRPPIWLRKIGGNRSEKQTPRVVLFLKDTLRGCFCRRSKGVEKEYLYSRYATFPTLWQNWGIVDNNNTLEIPLCKPQKLS